MTKVTDAAPDFPENSPIAPDKSFRPEPNIWIEKFARIGEDISGVVSDWRRACRCESGRAGGGRCGPERNGLDIFNE